MSLKVKVTRTRLWTNPAPNEGYSNLKVGVAELTLWWKANLPVIRTTRLEGYGHFGYTHLLRAFQLWSPIAAAFGNVIIAGYHLEVRFLSFI